MRGSSGSIGRNLELLLLNTRSEGGLAGSRLFVRGNELSFAVFELLLAWTGL